MTDKIAKCPELRAIFDDDSRIFVVNSYDAEWTNREKGDIKYQLSTRYASRFGGAPVIHIDDSFPIANFFRRRPKEEMVRVFRVTLNPLDRERGAPDCFAGAREALSALYREVIEITKGRRFGRDLLELYESFAERLFIKGRDPMAEADKKGKRTGPPLTQLLGPEQRSSKKGKPSLGSAASRETSLAPIVEKTEDDQGAGGSAGQSATGAVAPEIDDDTVSLYFSLAEKNKMATYRYLMSVFPHAASWPQSFLERTRLWSIEEGAGPTVGLTLDPEEALRLAGHSPEGIVNEKLTDRLVDYCQNPRRFLEEKQYERSGFIKIPAIIDRLTEELCRPVSLEEIMKMVYWEDTGVFEWRLTHGSDIRVEHLQLRALFGHRVRIEPDELYGKKMLVDSSKSDRVPMFGYVLLTQSEWLGLAEDQKLVPGGNHDRRKIMIFPLPPNHRDLSKYAKRIAADKERRVLLCVSLRALVRDAGLVAYGRRGWFETWLGLSLSDCQYAIDLRLGHVLFLRSFKTSVLLDTSDIRLSMNDEELRNYREDRIVDHQLIYTECPVCREHPAWGLYHCKCGAPVIPERGFMMWAMISPTRRGKGEAGKGRMIGSKAGDSAEPKGGKKGKASEGREPKEHGESMNPDWLESIKDRFVACPYVQEEVDMLASAISCGNMAMRYFTAASYRFRVCPYTRTSAPIKQGDHHDSRMEDLLRKEAARGTVYKSVRDKIRRNREFRQKLSGTMANLNSKGDPAYNLFSQYVRYAHSLEEKLAKVADDDPLHFYEPDSDTEGEGENDRLPRGFDPYVKARVRLVKSRSSGATKAGDSAGGPGSGAAAGAGDSAGSGGAGDQGSASMTGRGISRKPSSTTHRTPQTAGGKQPDLDEMDKVMGRNSCGESCRSGIACNFINGCDLPRDHTTADRECAHVCRACTVLIGRVSQRSAARARSISPNASYPNRARFGGSSSSSGPAIASTGATAKAGHSASGSAATYHRSGDADEGWWGRGSGSRDWWRGWSDWSSGADDWWHGWSGRDRDSDWWNRRDDRSGDRRWRR